MRYSTALFVVTAAIAFCLNAEAEDNLDEAKAIFDKGRVLFAEGEFAQAAEAFRKANELKPNWKLLYNIGQSEAAAKHYGLALESLESYLLEGGDEIARERQGEVRTEIARLRDLSGDLEVHGPDGAVVLVNGVKRGTLPLAGQLRVAGGLHTIMVTHDGDVLTERQMKIPGRGQVSLEVEVEVEIPETKTAPVLVESTEDENESDDGSGLAVIGWITAATGAAVAIAGAVTGGLAKNKADELGTACPGEVCNAEDYKLKEEATSMAIATDVLIPVGSVLAAAGIVMVIVGSLDQSEETVAFSVAPMLSAGVGGMVIEGRF